MMTFSSSPVLYPPNFSPVAIAQKRKLFQSFKPRELSPKRPRILGGFIDEDDSDDEQGFSLPTIKESVQVDHALEVNRVGSEVKSVERIEKAQDGLGKSPPQNASNTNLLSSSSYLTNRLAPKAIESQTSSGQKMKIYNRKKMVQKSYESLIAERSVTAPGKADKAYYGVDIHLLMDEARTQKELEEAASEYRKQTGLAESVEVPAHHNIDRQVHSKTYQMWTEKYRARKFTDLVGDERTHRSVLRWLKGWDAIVFPGNSKVKRNRIHEDQDQLHRKILLLTGPPGLGKTTLAHVCAKQAGYEVLEINASDDRTREVVRGRIKDALGTETVRGVMDNGKARTAGRPVCVIVDEVDGVVTGSSGSGGEGGFIRALIDLVQLDQRSSGNPQPSHAGKRRGEKFRLMRPLILICNDVYAPSLRPLRQSSLAEIVHVRKPGIDKVISRLKSIFDKEQIRCDNDAVRRLCESSWGLGTRKQNSISNRGASDGDIRGVLVQGEWLAHKLRATCEGELKLTRKWVEEHTSKATASQNGLGRGGVKEIVERIFIEGAGLPNLPTALSKDDARLVAESNNNSIGVADLRKRAAITALQGMIDTTGDHERLMTDCFATYPTQTFQDDTLLSKPNASYEWLNFHDMLSSKVYSSQEWELNPYLSTSACGFHDLFAAVDRGNKSWNDEKPQEDQSEQEMHPFGGLKADFAAYEAEKANRTIMTEMQAGFSAPMLRLFSSVDNIAMELVPNVGKMLAPEVKPVVVGGSSATASVASVRKENEKSCVKHAVRVMHNLGIEFEKVKIESEGLGAHSNGGYALRMEPPLDELSAYHFSKPSSASTSANSSGTASNNLKPAATAPVRYAVRQVLSQELSKEKILQASLTRQARAIGLSATALSAHPTANSSAILSDDKENDSPDGAKTIMTLTAIATATANLTSAPGSATVLPPNTVGPVKRDFFGRPITCPDSSTTRPQSRGGQSHNRKSSSATAAAGQLNDSIQSIVQQQQRTWVSFHEGYSNAVRKYIGLRELMDGF